MIAGIVCACMGIFVIGSIAIQQQKQNPHKPKRDNDLQKCIIPLAASFYDEQLFVQSMSKGVNMQKDDHLVVQGVIIPHHLLASSIIADLMQYIATQDIQKIIIIGPNHWERGKTSVVTSACGWNTPYGDVSSAVDHCTDRSFVSCDNDVMREEHSLGAVMPYIAHLMPQARVIPFAISQKITPQEQVDLADMIAQETNKARTVVILSMDFSHYLSDVDAEKMDRETLAAITDFSYNKILSYNSDHVDSPQGLAVFLRTMQLLGAEQNSVMHHTNSSRLLRDPFAQTTSYFGIVYTQ